MMSFELTIDKKSSLVSFGILLEYIFWTFHQLILRDLLGEAEALNLSSSHIKDIE